MLKSTFPVGLQRCQVPDAIASAAIGHEVASLSTKGKDNRVKNYAYALGHTSEDICTVVRIISSGYRISYHKARDTLHLC